MSIADYTNIERLIANQEQNGSRVVVTFRCPENGVEAEATGTVRCSKEVKATIERSVKKNVWSSLRRTAASTIASTLGNGVAGRIAKDAAKTALGNQAKKTEFSKEEIRAAVVDAFNKVQAKFQWEATNEQWIGVQ